MALFMFRLQLLMNILPNYYLIERRESDKYILLHEIFINVAWVIYSQSFDLHWLSPA